MYKKISDYGIIGDLHSIALVGLDGSIDWFCLPYIDSPSIFAALLDDKEGGRFSISPLDDWDSAAECIPDTNILVTKFRTRTGVMQVTDFMPIFSGGEAEYGGEQHELYRLVEVTKGKVDVGLSFEPRFNYSRGRASLKKGKRAIIARGNGDSIVLSSTHDLQLGDGKAEAKWSMSEGEQLWLHLRYGVEEPIELDREKAATYLRETEAYWRSWFKKRKIGRTIEEDRNLVEEKEERIHN